VVRPDGLVELATDADGVLRLDGDSYSIRVRDADGAVVGDGWLWPHHHNAFQIVAADRTVMGTLDWDPATDPLAQLALAEAHVADACDAQTVEWGF
jgi:hypothetical protein